MQLPCSVQLLYPKQSDEPISYLLYKLYKVYIVSIFVSNFGGQPKKFQFPNPISTSIAMALVNLSRARLAAIASERCFSTSLSKAMPVHPVYFKLKETQKRFQANHHLKVG